MLLKEESVEEEEEVAPTIINRKLSEIKSDTKDEDKVLDMYLYLGRVLGLIMKGIFSEQPIIYIFLEGEEAGGGEIKVLNSA